MLYYLLKAGIDPQKDVELIGIGAGPAMVLALEQRKVDAFASARTASALALLLVALVGLYYLLAQGRSSLARYLEDVPAPVERAALR